MLLSYGLLSAVPQRPTGQLVPTRHAELLPTVALCELAHRAAANSEAAAGHSQRRWSELVWSHQLNEWHESIPPAASRAAHTAAVSSGSAADEEGRRVLNSCIQRLIHQLSTLRERVSVIELDASAQPSSYLSGSVRRRGLRKAPKLRVDAYCTQPRCVIDFQLAACGAEVKGDAVLGLDKRDKQHSLCTAAQRFSTGIGPAGKGLCLHHQR